MFKYYWFIVGFVLAIIGLIFLYVPVIAITVNPLVAVGFLMVGCLSIAIGFILK